MKISNNALNFLLAQYRAIFKRAYVKGIASAVLLTAGLAAGQAQAAATTLDGTTNLLPDEGQTATIDGSGTSTGYIDNAAQFGNINITGGEDYTLNGTLVITSGSADSGNETTNNRIIGTSGDTKIVGSGTITIAIDGGTASTDGLLIGGNTNKATVDINAINVQKGILKVSDKAATQSGDAVVSAGTIKVGTEDGNSEAYLTATSAGSGKTVTVGRDSGTGITASVIDVYGGGTLTLETTAGNGITVKGSALNLAADALMITKGGADDKNKIETDNLTLAADSFKVITGTDVGETFAGNTAKIAGNVLVGSGAEWVLAAVDKDDADGNTIKGTTTFESGANVQVGGTLTVSGGTLTVDDGAQLVATAASDGTSNAGTIVVAKNSSNKSGTLVISSADLKDFLTAKNGDENITYKAITTDDDDKYIVDSEDSPAAKGSVFLSGGILQLSDNTKIDLATDLAFSGAATSGSAGLITVSTTGGTVKGHNLQVSKAIANVTATNKLSVEADILTFGGSTTSNTETKLSQFNISGAIAHNEVNLEANDGKGTFIIDQTLNLNGDYYTKDASGDYTTTLNSVGQIKGDNLILSGSSAKAPLTINGGAWENEGQSLTIQSGTLTVGAVSGDTTQADGKDTNGTWKYTKNGNPASLTWHGDFIFDGNSQASDAEVKVTGASGADATLDLTDAYITWGSGSITLSGALASGEDDPVQVSPTDYFARAGQGILKLDGDQVSDFLGLSGVTGAKADTHLKIEDGGLLLVNGSINNDLDVASTFTSSDTAKQIWLSGGNMFVTGSLSLVDGVNGQGGAADATANGLTIDGILGADTISYTNKSTSIDSKKPETDVATVSGGTLAVASSFSSKNHEVKFVSGAGLLLASKGFLQEWAPETAGEGGTVSVDHLTFSGVKGTDKSTLDVQTGAWTIGSANNLGDVDILEGAELNVGPESAEFIRTGFGASLTLDNLTVTSGASSNSGSVTVQDGSKITVNTIQIDAGSELTVGYGATVTITGNYAHNLSGGKLVDGVPEGLTDLGATNVDKQAGINLEGADITLNSGKLVIGDTAARKASYHQ